MTPNVGGIDRALRVTAGIAALLFAVLSDSDMRWWGLAGLVPLATGMLRWCPAYPLLGLNSCPTKSSS
jgi:hypothetical protein